MQSLGDSCIVFLNFRCRGIWDGSGFKRIDWLLYLFCVAAGSCSSCFVGADRSVGCMTCVETAGETLLFPQKNLNYKIAIVTMLATIPMIPTMPKPINNAFGKPFF